MEKQNYSIFLKRKQNFSRKFRKIIVVPETNINLKPSFSNKLIALVHLLRISHYRQFHGLRIFSNEKGIFEHWELRNYVSRGLEREEEGIL